MAEAVKYADGYLREHLSPGGGVLDIGANGGMLAAEYARAVGPDGYVLAVEPDPTSFAALQHGLRDLPHAHPVQAAVGAVRGETVIYPDGLQTSRWKSLTSKPGPAVTVPMTTLDQLAPLVPNLLGIKIDVQGGEYDVLEGAAETLTRAHVVWQIELWPKGLDAAGTSAGAVCDRLEAAGLVPLSRSWAQVREQCGRLNGSYLDVVCRHAG